MNTKRPKHLALHQIKLPLPGLVSILHRFSGVLIFLCLPLLLWMFQASLRSVVTYTQLLEILQNPFSKLALLGMTWAFLHHLCAGIRYLLIDLRYISTLAGARLTSKWVLFASLGLTIVIGAKLW